MPLQPSDFDLYNKTCSFWKITYYLKFHIIDDTVLQKSYLFPIKFILGRVP